MKSKLSLVAVISLLVVGCSNPYAKFYQDRTGGIDITKSPRVILPTNKPQLFRGSNLDEDIIYMVENGFGLVGFSSFNGSQNIDASAALEQATNIHASVVVVYSKFTNTVSGSVPLILPDNQTTTTKLSGNVIGPRGTATYSGTAYSTTYGTSTMLIPYSINRYDYFASYWIKLKPYGLGVQAQDLSAKLKQKIGSNKGVVIIAVIKDSPAFDADILRGDIFKRIGDREVLDLKTFSEAIKQYTGKKVEVLLIRDGKEFTKEIILKERN